MTTLVVTVIGDDRPGLVDALAAAVAEHGGSWERSSMARLGTKFAGIVEVEVDAARADAVAAGLDALQAQGVLHVTVERAGAAAAERPTVSLELRLVGQDRPGIVHEIAHALAEHDVGIDELQTTTSSAPMSAEQLFEADARLRVPADLDHDRLSTALEALA